MLIERIPELIAQNKTVALVTVTSASGSTPAEVGTASPTETQPPPTGGYAFATQTDPASISSVLYRPEWGCEWMGLVDRW